VTLTEIQEALKRLASVDDTDPLAAWINAAYHEFEMAFEWPFLELFTSVVLTPNLGTVTLPSNFLRVNSLKITGQGCTLDYIGFREFEDNVLDPTVTGLPTLFTVIGQESFMLYPVPDSGYTLRLFYRRKLDDLVDPTDVPEIPVAYHYAIVSGAADYALQAESEEDRSSVHRNNFEAQIDKAIEVYGTKQNTRFGQIRDTQGYGY
jgi:hypothetical protein